MSFPGYLKSLNLISKRDDNPEDVSRVHDQPVEVDRGSQEAMPIMHENVRPHKELQQTHEEERILDERGKPPSKSLWVGNIPSRTTSSELRVLFSEFGRIISTRVLNKCAFVNFETLESAIAAWKECHDQDIFHTGDQTINIRFTSTFAEARQSSDVRERRSSISVKADATHKQWFQPIESNPNTSPTQSNDGIEWPNGKPPTGPKSQRREISPPSLRRGDSYRPAELSRKDSYKSELDYKRSDRDDYSRGRDHRRRLHQRYSPEYSSSHSPSSNGTSSGNTSPKRFETRGDISPLPWERRRSREQIQGAERTDESEGMETGIPDTDVATIAAHSGNQESVIDDFREKRTDKEDGSISPPSIRLRTPEIGPQICVPCTSSPAMSGYSPSLEIDGNYLSATLMSQSKQISTKSPSLRSIDRVRGEDGYLSGSPVPSEVATSSSKTSTRRRRCYDCKKAGSDLAPLISCSKCTRRFHAGCGKPKPSSCADKSTYVCERCKRTGEAGAQAEEVSTSSEAKRLKSLDGKVHLASPPLTLDQSGSASANLSPRDDLSNLLSATSGLESFFQRRAEDAESDALMGSTESKLSPKLQTQSKKSTFKEPPLSQPTPTSPISPSIDDPSVLKNRNKYKIVTCKWWASNSCTQTEDGCYYAHEYTGIAFPDRRRPNKSWTCYNWLHNKCVLLERDCLHAHKDTGLHIWRDGRPSFKHVTCFWWLKARCKWKSESCKFAHDDTGLYSLDPSEIWQGGMKFSTINPSEDLNRSSQQYRAAEPLNVSANIRPGDGTRHSGEKIIENSTRIIPNHSSPANGMKPSLTITTTDRPSFTQQDRLHSDPWQFSNSIGAPPQTPSEDSPSKIGIRGGSSQTAFGFPPRTGDLPTPATEDCPGDEDEIRDYVSYLPSQTKSLTSSKSQADAEARFGQTTAVNLRDSCSKTLRAHENPVCNQTSIPGTPRLNEAHDVHSRDPRLMRKELIAEHTTETCVEENSGVESSLRQSPQSQFVKAFTGSKATSIDEIPRRGVKKCQKCAKPVFGTDICRVCSSGSGRVDDSGKPKTSDPVERSLSVISRTGEKVRKPTTVGDAQSTAIGQAADAARLQDVSKNTLKRSAVGSNMFLKNKRPKSSMMYSSSGSIRPEAFRRESTGKRPQSSIRSADGRREHQTLEDLIQEERERKRGDPMVPTSYRRTVGEGETGCEPSDNANEQPLPETTMKDQDRSEIQVNRKTPPVQTRISDVAYLFSSPKELCEGDRLDTLNPSGHPEVILKHSSEEHRVTKSGERPSHDPSDRRSSESPQPGSESDAQPQSTKETDEPTRITKTVAQSLQHLLVDQEPAIPNLFERKKLPMPQTLLSRPIVVSPEKFSWASPITCTQCQKHHKKCLHDDSGRLSAVKCRDYVLSRNGKPDTGRSRQEWSAILEASELDPDSDSEASEDEASQVAQSLDESESEDEFATAIDGDEMLVDGPDDGPEALLESSRRPPLQEVHISAVKQSRPSISKFFVKTRSDHWTISQEEVKRKELEKKGVMFESDSEDEDYLSDHHETPEKQEWPIDPLRKIPTMSKNLFAIAPELDHLHVLRQMEKLKSIQVRPSRKVQWVELRGRQIQERRERFGNAHWEVDRKHSDVVVTALIERIVPPQNVEDRFAVGSVQKREEKIIFRDFLGVPKLPEICLMNDEERLAFRDEQKERDRIFGRTGRGLGRPTTDEEKWPVRAR